MNLIIKIKNNSSVNDKILEFQFLDNNIEKAIFSIKFLDDTTTEMSKMFEFILKLLYENKGNIDMNINEIIPENISELDKTIIHDYIKLLKDEIKNSKDLIQKMFIN